MYEDAEAMETPEMEESRRQAAIKLGLTPDQLKGLEAQATKPGEQKSDQRPVVPDAKPLPQGDTGRYRWRQTSSEVEIIVPIDDRVRARDISWSVSRTHLTLGVKGQEVLNNARLTHEVKLGAGHTWQLDTDEGQRCIVATLEKKDLHETWFAIEEDIRVAVQAVPELAAAFQAEDAAICAKQVIGDPTADPPTAPVEISEAMAASELPMDPCTAKLPEAATSVEVPQASPMNTSVTRDPGLAANAGKPQHLVEADDAESERLLARYQAAGRALAGLPNARVALRQAVVFAEALVRDASKVEPSVP